MSGDDSTHLEGTVRTRTQVGIVGAGPAGLLIGNLLLQANITCIVVEQQTREYIEGRARAGLIEPAVVECLQRAGLADRLLREGMLHDSCEFRSHGQRFSLPYAALCGGRKHSVYPQQELVKDLITSYLNAGGDLRFATAAYKVTSPPGERPCIQTATGEIVCDFVAGCDGSYSVVRQSLPDESLTTHAKQYDMGLLAVLAAAPPSTRQIIYAVHERGFAGHMLRTATESRYYLQCQASESVENWPDERIWRELETRLSISEAWALTRGSILEKRVLEMRSSVCEPMHYGSVYLVGDAAHVLTPMGAKGMNLAMADAVRFVEGILRYYEHNDRSLLDTYSERCLQRVWSAQAFSDALIQVLFPPGDDEGKKSFLYKLQIARLDRLRSSKAAAASFAEEYVGSPISFERK